MQLAIAALAAPAAKIRRVTAPNSPRPILGDYVNSPTNTAYPAKDSVSLRPHNGKVTVTDGPYAETVEQLGSYFLIEARDLNEAIQLASKHPAARLNEHLGWGIEIRPIAMCRVAFAAGNVGR